MKKSAWRKPMITLLLVALSAAGILVLLGRGSGKKEEPAKKPRIAAIIPEGTVSMEIWQDMWKGVRKAAGELGMSLSEYPYPVGRPASLLASLLETACLSQVDGILLCGNTVNDPEVRRILKEAREKGIRIVLCESDSAPEYRDAFVGFDNTQVGRRVAELLAGEELDRVFLASDTTGVSATAHVQRAEGVVDTLGELCPDLPVEFPGISEKGIRYTYAMEEFFRSHALEYTGMVCFTSSQTVQLAEMVENLELGEQTFFIGFDEGEETDAYLESGIIDALITQDNESMGETGMRVLAALLAGQEAESAIYLDPVVIAGKLGE